MKQFITRAYGASKLLLKANAPTIMVVGGVVSMGAGAIVACKQTLVIEEVLEPHVEMLEKIKQGEELGIQGYQGDTAAKDRYKVYARVGRDVGKLYAVPGVLFFGGAALVFGGHRIMVKRNATLALAYTGLKKSFDAYRGRVREQWGSEADRAMMSGYSLKEIEDEQGNKTLVPVIDQDTARIDPYNRIFEQGATPEWRNDYGANIFHVSNQERMANFRLNRYGILYLNEVYESLGFPRTDVGQVVGWKVKTLPDGTKDIPMVSFGVDVVHPMDDELKKSKAIYLDFNCQGLIVGGQVQKALEKA